MKELYAVWDATDAESELITGTKEEMEHGMNERINEIRERHWRGVSAFNVGHVSSDIGYLLAEVDKYKALAENGQSAIDTNKRLLKEIELLRGQLDAKKAKGETG